MAVIAGWGRGTWSQGTWGEPLPVVVTGEAATGATGSVTVVAVANVPETGLSASSAVGSVSIDAVANTSVTGLEATGSEGSVAVKAKAVTAASGSAATGGVGSVTLSTQQILSMTGVAGTTSVGDETVSAAANTSVTGEEATSGLGSVSVVAEAVIAASGSEATVSDGNETVTGDANLTLTGEEATGQTTEQGVFFAANGDAQLATAEKKFGTASLKLDGTGDFVKSDASDVTSGNFTVEFFIYTDNILQDAYLWDNQVSNSGFAVAITSLGKIRIIKDNVIQGTFNSGLSDSTWHHVALVGNGNTLTVFVDGFSKGQKNIFGGIGTYSDQPYYIGARHNETQFFNGYIDEFRTSNTPRYSLTFTPTTSAFSTDSNTLELLHFDGTDGSKQIVNETQGLSVVSAANVSTTGLAATSGLGSVVVDAEATVPETGLSANGNVGSVTATGVGNVTVTGGEATAADGTVATDGDALVTLFTELDSELQGAVGTVVAGVRVTVSTTGLSAGTNVGNVDILIKQIVDVAGASVDGEIGNVVVPSQIVPNQQPVYANPAGAQPGQRLSAPSYNNVGGVAVGQPLSVPQLESTTGVQEGQALSSASYKEFGQPGGTTGPGKPLSTPGYKQVA